MLFYLLGKCLLAPFENSDGPAGEFTWFNTLLYLSAGAIGVVSLFSLLRTGGVTVNLYFILVGIFLLVRRFSTGKSPVSFRIKVRDHEIGLLMLTILALILLVLVQLIRYDYFNPEISRSGHSDYYFYITMAEKMSHYHIEGINFETEPLFAARHYRLPYHYFDIWLNGFFQSVASLDKTDAYLFVATPVTATLSFLALAAVLSVYIPSRRWVCFLAAFLLIFYYLVIPVKAGSFFRNTILLPKIFPAILCCGIAFVFFYRKQTAAAFLTLTFMPVMNILATPAVLMAIGIAGLVSLWKKEYRSGLQYLAIAAGVFLFIVLFYAAFGNITGTSVSNRPPIGVFLRQAVHILLRDYLVRIWLFGLPLIFFVLTNYKSLLREWRENGRLFSFYLFLLLIGTLLTALLSFFVDAWQFDFFPTYAALLIFTTVAIGVYLKHAGAHGPVQKLAFGILAVQVIFSFYSSFSRENTNPESRVSKAFIKEITEKLPARSVGGLIYNDSLFTNSEWAYNPFVFQDGYFMGLVPKSTDLILLSLPTGIDSDPKYASGGYALIKNSEFLAASRTQQDTAGTLDERQSQFIKRRKLNFLIVQKNASLGDHVRSMVKEEVQDKVTGVRFILLNNSSS